MILLFASLTQAAAGPVYTDPTLILYGDEWDNFGREVAGAGDLNGDGYDDLVISAVYANDYHGEVYVYTGSEDGAGELSATLTQDDESYFSYSMSSAGDVNGDGYDDLFVSGYDTLPNAYLYYGSEDGLDEAPDVLSDASTGVYFDYYSAAAGDFDGDGYGDVAMGLWTRNDLSGEVYVHSGAAGGLDTSPYLTLSGTSDAYLGQSLSAGDIDGDGYDDLLVAAPNIDDGSVYLYYGSALGLSSASPTTLSAVGSLTAFGYGLAVGDVNCDGYDDVSVGAYLIAMGDGAVHTYYGGAGGIDTSPDTLYGGDVERLGGYLAGGFDANGDGCEDLIAGMPNADDSIGGARVYAGSLAGLDAGTPSDLAFEPDSSNYRFGLTVTGVGDLNGDGYSEVGAATFSTADQGGAVYLYSGGADEDGDGALVDDDCDDDDAAVGALRVLYADSDEDGYGDETDSVEDCEGEVEGYIAASSGLFDCDDTDSAINPDAEEFVADGVDSDCDGEELCYTDVDGDGYTAESPIVSLDLDCEDPREDDGSLPGGDCNDREGAVNPGEAEVCDGFDNDCSGDADGADAPGAVIWYLDADDDGYGEDGDSLVACYEVDRYRAEVGGDCDDADGAINPDGMELCDGADNDCDGGVDVGALDAALFFTDDDGDGFGDPAGLTESCEVLGEGYATNDNDCDDTSAASWPGAGETCDGEDNDCDAAVDEEASDTTTWFLDEDGDGYPTGGVFVEACEPPEGYTAASAGSDDCDDHDPGTWPGAEELCDAEDRDCDGDPQAGAVDTELWYADADGDGYVDLEDTIESCDAPDGYAPLGESDCDDADAGSHPGAEDTPGDGVDQDCDGADAEVSGDDTDDTDDTDNTDSTGSDDGEKSGCSYGGTPSGWLTLLLPALALWRRRALALSAGALVGCQAPEALERDASESVAGRALDAADATVFTGDESNARFGYRIAGAGDVNGDGYDDLLTSAYWADDDRGRLHLYYGGEGGPALEEEVILQAPNAAGLGFSLSSGDVDCDGYSDVLASGYQDRTEAYLWYGGAGGLYTTPVVLETGARNAGWSSVSVVGDLNGDGCDDVALGMPSLNSNRGEVHVFYGSASGLSTTSDDSLEGSASGDYFGWIVGGGDVNGDGYDDLLLGVPGPQFVVVVRGSAGGLGTAEYQLDSPAGSDFFGNTLAAGDVDGDGYDDVVTGDYARNYNEGGIAVFRGGPSGPSSSATWTLIGPEMGSRYGTSIAFAGDVDTDGVDELIVSATGSGDAGVVHIHPLGPDGPGESSELVAEEDRGADFGQGLAGLGDLDGDGAPDLGVGAPNADGVGRLYVFFGEVTDDDGDGAAAATDCDDTDPDVFPEAEEVCDGADDDCDGLVDEDAVDATLWYLDSDGDGYGDAWEEALACEAPAEHVADGSDCDDDDPDAWPDAPEVPDDGIDQDCDGFDAPAEDTSPPEDTASPEDTAEPPSPPEDSKSGCGCSGAPAPSGWLLLLPLMAALRRRQVEGG